ncbi:3-dehydroquinate synthase II [Vallitalea guaymasensis]|uniref:3-dehydroquinate synthase II n=1 Tax=Vallitalea guaymasensis TaxID=1185412 RepID=UPI002354CDDA|nr:3-dehydroquinate synthase II [Vallitalea guaymasensis]
MKKELWFDGSVLSPEETGLITDATNRGYTTVILNKNQLKKVKVSNRVKKAIRISSIEEVEKFDKIDIFIVDNLSMAEQLINMNKCTAYYTTVNDRENMEKAADIRIPLNYLIIEFQDTTNIPLELILAKLQNDKVKVMKVVNESSDAIVAMGVMEIGSAGVIMKSKNIHEIVNLSNEIIKKEMKKMDLVECEVVEIKHLELGERACLDSTSIMSKTEGMIVGCTSSGGLLICSEVHYLPYMNTRPFRVNAGTISSYVWGPNNIVEYISDLEAGSKLLAVDINGDSRTVNVARVKSEVRPLILIVTRYKDVEIKAIMQDDWHMRVFSPEGKAVNITDLKPGDKVMGHCSEPGRHVGIKISETIIEK